MESFGFFLELTKSYRRLNVKHYLASNVSASCLTWLQFNRTEAKSSLTLLKFESYFRPVLLNTVNMPCHVKTPCT